MIMDTIPEQILELAQNKNIEITFAESCFITIHFLHLENKTNSQPLCQQILH